MLKKRVGQKLDKMEMTLTSKEQEARERVCLALDVPTVHDALKLSSELSDLVGLFKVGKQLHTVAGNEGVERIFPLHSPNVVDVKPTRSGKVRRAKLYFLRDRVGKGVRLKQRQTEHTRAR